MTPRSEIPPPACIIGRMTIEMVAHCECGAKVSAMALDHNQVKRLMRALSVAHDDDCEALDKELVGSLVGRVAPTGDAPNPLVKGG
jgi:hypothetical protein